MPASIELLHELVDRFTAATQANLNTKGRRGSTVHLMPDWADEILVTGDLHGNRANFLRIVNDAQLASHPKRHLVVQEVVHGGPTYATGGCMSHLVLEDVAKLKVEFPDRVHFLLCNHELSECMKLPIVKSGVSQNYRFSLGLETAYGPAAVRIAECYHQFILACPLAIRLKNNILVSHSLPDKKALPTFDTRVLSRRLSTSDLLVGGSGHAMVWGRDYDVDHVERVGKTLQAVGFVTGHEPTPAGFQAPNPLQIVLDASGAKCFVLPIPVAAKSPIDALKSGLRELS